MRQIVIVSAELRVKPVIQQLPPTLNFKSAGVKLMTE
jgi:hypothetical protein